VAEVQLYPNSDCVLRFVSGPAMERRSLPFLPGYASIGNALPTTETLPPPTFGIARIDHVVGNVPDMSQV